MKKPLKRLKITRMKKNNISSLYIHIPFCTHICAYCDFPKLQFFRSFGEKYLKVLKQELEEQVKTKDLKTIYIGGGTPTALDDDLFLELLKILEPYSKYVIEYTVEVNPESLSLDKARMMKEYGVNRVSIGVQSTNDEILKLIGRKHSYLDVKKAVENLKSVGIDNYNVDLILGLPGVSLEMVKKDLKNLISLKPKHISTYSLTVHEHTKFALDKVEEPDEDFAYNLYKEVDEYLAKEGFSHYEVSNFALRGYESKHNLVYWRNEEYYGIGLGAASYIAGVRYKNTDNLSKYLEGNFDKEIEELSFEDKIEYQIMLNLRTKEGLNLADFKKEYDIDLYNDKKGIIDSFISRGYLKLENNILSPTFDGMMILDRIILDLI